jgi:hypothetical protein
VKLPVVAPAATVTDPGTVNAVLFDESATTAPPERAAFASVTVQDDVPPDHSDAGVQASAVTVGGAAVTVTPAAALPPFSDAVTVAV